MPLAPGTRIGPYEVSVLIGEGGMGQVWRARDTTLRREVAIKTLPDAFANDSERIARFEREAHVLASVNHPNIAHIYGLERAGGMLALVMELVEGPTLAERVNVGWVPRAGNEATASAPAGLPIDETLAIAKQIAQALEAAHEQGVIHRDLKPANIKLRADGTVKVLDFGLAKAVESAPRATSASQSPTITSPAMMTGVGMLLGTAAYMSPEQARGQDVDKRADIWAFGCVLFEMLTGKRTFDDPNVSDTLASVLKSEPDWSALPPDLPRPIRTMVRRCLEKDRRKRIADMSTVLFVLDEVATPAEGSAKTAHDLPGQAEAGHYIRRNDRRRMAIAIAAALMLGAVVAGGAVWLASRPSAPRVARFGISPTGTAAITAIALDRELAITPDGAHVVYVGNSGTQLFVRALDHLDPSALGGLGQPRGPFLSPDGRWIGFFDGAGGDVTLKKVTIAGGPAVSLCSFTGSQRAGGTWGEDGTIIFATTARDSGLWRVSAGGGAPTMLTKPDNENGEGDHLWPEFIPGREAVLFTIVPATDGIDAAQVAVLDLATGAQKMLIQGGSHAHYMSSGHLVYGVAGTLRAVAFDVERLEVTGTPIPVLSSVLTTTAGAANFDVARDGTLVYVAAREETASSAPQRTLVWVDRQGREAPIDAPARSYVYPRLSPAGTEIALDIRDQQNDIWIWSLAGHTLTRLTFNPGFDSYPAWTADGRRLMFQSQTTQVPEGIYWQAADGTGTAERLTETSVAATALSVAPDNATLVFSAGGASADVMMLTLDKERRVQPLVRSQFNERNAEVSPDGRWLAYEANDSGQFQIYVRPFPAVNSGRWQISTTGGGKPLWSRNGQELFYFAPTGSLLGVRVDTGIAWKATTPVTLLERQYFQSAPGRTYDVGLDGKQFLMIKPDPSEPAAPNGAPVLGRLTEEGLIVVQNWSEELTRLVPRN